MQGPNVGTPHHEHLSGDEEEEEEVGAHYSILPIRSETVFERWKYRTRRFVFYSMFLAFLVLVMRIDFMVNDLGSWFWVIHLFYFDLDVTVTKNQRFVRFFHGCSFIGSFITAAIGSLVVAVSPDFIPDRSEEHHISMAFIWVIHSITNYLPPLFHGFDMYYNYEALRKRHYLQFVKPGTKSKPYRYSPLRQFGRMLWTMLSPVLVVAVWFLVPLHPEYDVIKEYFSVMIPALVVLDILSGVLFFVVLVVKPKVNSAYPPLLEK